MARPGTFRIFVSSTFGDLEEERNALQERVFPRLRELCMQHGARFQAIDLRWGVSEEAALDQQTMNICLGEIERCRRITPRPNFMVLLGDRYGWRPLPPEIVADEFEEICRRISDGEKQRLREWYERDDNAVPPEYCLKRREEECEDFGRWEVVEREIRSILLGAVQGMPLEAHDRMKYEASATEQEIAQGALRVADAGEHVFCFFRTIKDLPQVANAKDFVDLDAGGSPDTEAAARRDELKIRLRNLLPGNIRDYEAGWTGSGATTDHLPQLCDDVFNALSRIIEEELARLEEADPLEKEAAEHDAFGKERARFFTGRDSIRNAIANYIGGSDRNPLAVLGEPGSGKSALMAKAAEEARAAHPEAKIFVGFIGATPASSDGRALLNSLCRQISRAYGADESTVPAEYNDLAVEFGKRLELATAERPLIVFLDALDQLGGADPARSLSWLPAVLPEHVSLVVSTLPGDCEAALRGKHPAPRLVTVEPMTKEEGAGLLDVWLKEARRELQPAQHAEVLGRFAAEGLPLYLKLAFEEARLWHSYSDPQRTVLKGSIPALIRENLFARLAKPASHGHLLVSHALGYLAASRYGLSEDELLDVLCSDKEVFDDFKERARHEPPKQRLPVVVWSRLYFDLEPYLSEHGADGTTLLAFYHGQLREAASRQYLADDAGRKRHAALADYFRHKSDPAHDRTWTGGYARGLSELPYHLAGADDLDELYQTLTDFTFLEHKAAEVGIVEHPGAEGKTTKTHTGVFLLQDDYALSLAKLGGGPTATERKPLIVTGVDLGGGLVVRCPWCNKASPFQQDWRGTDIACPSCQGPLRVNS